MEEKYGRAKNFSCLIWLDSAEWAICVKAVHTKNLKKERSQNIYVIFTSFQFKIRIPLTVFCCFRFCFRGFSLILFYNKRKSLFGETLIETEFAVAKQTKKCDFVSFKTFYQRLKTHFEFSFGININFIYSISP